MKKAIFDSLFILLGIVAITGDFSQLWHPYSVSRILVRFEMPLVLVFICTVVIYIGLISFLFWVVQLIAKRAFDL